MQHRIVALPFILGLFALSLAGSAGAAPCAADCGAQKKGCVQSARVDKLACKLDCRSNVSGGELRFCMRDCVDGFRATRLTCREAFAGCHVDCGSPDPGDGAACLGICGRARGACAHGVAETMRSCVQDCKAAAPNSRCQRDCASAARDGGDTCTEEFAACTAACGATSSTTTTTLVTTTTTSTLPGSPATAFID